MPTHWDEFFADFFFFFFAADVKRCWCLSVDKWRHAGSSSDALARYHGIALLPVTMLKKYADWTNTVSYMIWSYFNKCCRLAAVYELLSRVICTYKTICCMHAAVDCLTVIQWNKIFLQQQWICVQCVCFCPSYTWACGPCAATPTSAVPTCSLPVVPSDQVAMIQNIRHTYSMLGNVVYSIHQNWPESACQGDLGVYMKRSMLAVCAH